ncbi:unnamed protein product [Rhizophagus irregularis]|uniref:Uncharacterized protein n=1 Tax=Rhizophagus irregularis TaxID=588596 RepID=A0A916EGD8_9GLOM|nr:unnamed protein product [Rhizophagus irregularis]CAB5216293.1 unnamed protein product [Rhizophagus irregularis]CAB5380395.1 unnamed protein product [Rhizophagus irregularis]
MTKTRYYDFRWEGIVLYGILLLERDLSTYFQYLGTISLTHLALTSKPMIMRETPVTTVLRQLLLRQCSFLRIPQFLGLSQLQGKSGSGVLSGFPHIMSCTYNELQKFCQRKPCDLVHTDL